MTPVPRGRVTLTSDPIAWSPLPFPLDDTESGSIVEFFGVVRGTEQGQPIATLHYEAYHAMAEHQLHRMIEELALVFPIRHVQVTHRLGAVPAGEPSLWVRVWSSHRAEGFAFLAAFCDRLKQDVPIWKVAPEPSPAAHDGPV